jgi:glycine/D-amino acid oxidase-like deaminating enzyme
MRGYRKTVEWALWFLEGLNEETTIGVAVGLLRKGYLDMAHEAAKMEDILRRQKNRYQILPKTEGNHG